MSVSLCVSVHVDVLLEKERERGDSYKERAFFTWVFILYIEWSKNYFIQYMLEGFTVDKISSRFYSFLQKQYNI